MKKIIITTVLCFGLLMPAIAQNTEKRDDPTLNKRGIALLPKAGDFAIGISANPFLKYLGGFMGGNSTVNGLMPTFGVVEQTLYGKYFLEDRVALRAKLHLNFGKIKFKDEVRDDYALLVDPTNVMARVMDVKTESINEFDINLGYEMRRGKGRVQGFFGGEVCFGYAKNKTTYSYGNPITESNQTPSISGALASPIGIGYRAVEVNHGTYLNFGLGGFAGVEYFFTPQISIGGEFNLGFAYAIKGQDEVKTEAFLDSGIVEYKYRERNHFEEAFNIGCRTVIGAELFLLFHF
ncbi:hypothetical protein LJC11_00920 [Bacteroidales bacterium OttesenSCG-928-I21]|nr:hypothetical protein [Bacteroidales bacterium OttesenSCG-928-I21]